MISAHKTDKYGAMRRQDLNNGGASKKRKDPVIGWGGGSCGIGNFFILWIMASNLSAAKSIAPCEVMEPG